MSEPTACVLSELSQAIFLLLGLHLPLYKKANTKLKAHLQLVHRLQQSSAQ